MATKIHKSMQVGGPELLNTKGADIASASTINLDTATGDLVDVTGTTAITAVTLSEGEGRWVRFTGALTFTHGASLVLPGAANITTAAGDLAYLRGYASSVVRCLVYTKASGVPVIAAAAGAITATMLASTLDLSGKTLTMPPNGSRAGEVVQVVNSTSGAVATGTTVLPLDDTIPQNTEGDEYMTLAVTPKAATNKLKIEVTVVLASSAGGTLAAALFQDSTAGALAVVGTRVDTTGSLYTLSFTHYMAAGTTSATTFKVRCGNSAAGTVTFNGVAAGREYGGVMSSSITITEIKV